MWKATVITNTVPEDCAPLMTLLGLEVVEHYYENEWGFQVNNPKLESLLEEGHEFEVRLDEIRIVFNQP